MTSPTDPDQTGPAASHLAAERAIQALLDVCDSYVTFGLDLQGIVRCWSAGAERLLGRSAAEMLGQHYRNLLVPDAGAFEVCSGLPNAGSYWCARQDESRAWVHFEPREVKGSAGRIVQLVDVRPLAPTRDVEGMLQALIDSSAYAIISTDPSGKITVFNRAAERLLGYSAEELVQRQTPARFHDHGEIVKRAAELSAALGRPVLPGFEAFVAGTPEGHAADERAWTYVRKDGSRISVLLSVTAIRAGDGRISGYLGVARDVTELNRLRQTAEEERLRLLSILDATSDLVALAEADGTLLYLNPAGCRLVGLAEEAALGKRLKDLFPQRAVRWVLESALPLAHHGGCVAYETTLQHVDGREIPVSQVLIATSGTDGQLKHVATISRDLRPLQRSQALLGKVATQVPGMLFELRREGAGRYAFSYVSSGSNALVGLPPYALKNSAAVFFEQVHPDDRPLISAALEASVVSGADVVLEYRVCTKPETETQLSNAPLPAVRWHQIRASAERDGDLVSWYGFATDVTEQRSALARVEQSKQTLDDAIASLDAGFAMYDAEARLMVCNRQYGEVQGIPPELCLPGTPYIDSLRAAVTSNPSYQGLLPKWLPLEAWLQSRLELFRSVASSHVVRLDQRWVRVDTRRIPSGGFVSLATDITQVKQAEFDARVQEQRLALATSAAEIGIWDVDLVTWKIAWDERLLTTYGLSRNDAPDTYQAWKECVHRDDVANFEKELHKCLEAGGEFRQVFRIVRPDGSVRHIDARAGLLRDVAGKLIRLIGVNLDITRHIETEAHLRAAAEAAEAASRAKADFLATMSHEIRTPMNGVIGMTNLLMGTRLDAEQRSFVETVRSSGESLLTLINDILDFSKMEAGKLQLERVAFSLSEQVNEALNLFTDQAERKGLRLVAKLPQGGQHVWGDPTRIRQILLNLISNAVKFTHAGTVEVALTAESRSEHDTEVCFTVADSGIGMSPQQLRRLGEAFSQADASTSRHYGGTGLGISICRRLVDMMSGTLEIDSQLGRGTTFRVTLVLQSALAGDTAPRSSLLPRSNTRPLRILVVEDNIVNQRVVSLMLRKYASVVDLASNGREGYERFRDGEYDCVLMDGQMPEVDGIEATRMIRALEESAARPRTPIIALTANALPGDRDMFLAAGMDEYLSKPVRPRDLALVLARVEAGEFSLAAG